MSSAQFERSFVAPEAPNTILVKVPGKVMYDFEKMQDVTRQVLRFVGCPGCHSGLDIRFLQLEREFEFNNELKRVAGLGAGD